MKEKQKKVELLAPAKDKDCAIAAINAGADAVYIGADGFGARKKAANSIEDIKEIIEYAHKFNVKVYITVNTIIYDPELSDVEKLIHKLWDIGADAIIIQDMGILKMNLPPIPIHASTQCHNNSLEKIEFLQSCNIERVVLPREFSLKEISSAGKSSNIELEVFIHGALCVCYSGQCYLSASIGSRSANRGECAQPCRKKYAVVDENRKKIAPPQYLLSMKDLSLEKHLNDLICAGVDSLKIEGRLKDADYVKNVVSFYRKKLDAIDPSLRPSEGILVNDFVPLINKTFNRGYTEFNISGNCTSLTECKTPKFLGEKIGIVTRVKGNEVGVENAKYLHLSDGIGFFDNKGNLCGTTITFADKNKIKVLNSSGIEKGTILYRNNDAEFFKKLKNTQFVRKIPLEISVLTKDEHIEITLNKEYTTLLQNNFEPANNPQKAKENLLSQFKKTADSEFIVTDINISDDFNLFIPVSILNNIRRTFISEYSEFRLNNYKRRTRDTQFKAIDYPIRELDYSFNISNRLSKEFFESCNAKVKETAFETGINGQYLMTSKHCIRRELNICLKNTKSIKSQKLYLQDEYGKNYPLEFDCKNCIMKVLRSVDLKG